MFPLFIQVQNVTQYNLFKNLLKFPFKINWNNEQDVITFQITQRSLCNGCFNKLAKILKNSEGDWEIERL